MFMTCYSFVRPDSQGKLRTICVPIAAVVDKFHIPGPVNYPPFEIAATVIGLVERLEGDLRHSELGHKLLDVSRNFIKELQADLPQEVEIREGRSMYIAYNIHGELHQFEVPTIIDFKEFKFPKPDPRNYPVLDLAITVIEMIEAVEPGEKRSQLSSKLVELSRDFIKNVQAGLPKGVQIREVPAPKAKALSAA